REVALLETLFTRRLDDMERCIFCGSELPSTAQFCGTCGRHLLASTEMPTRMLGFPTEGLPIDDGPTAMRGTGLPILRKQEDSFAQDTYRWSQSETTQPVANADEEDDEEGVFPLLGEGQPTSGTPMVQGTPQWGDVPLVRSGAGGPSAAAALRDAASAPPLLAPSSAPDTPLPSVAWQPSRG